MNDVTIRAAVAEDAAVIAGFANQFNALEGKSAELYTEALVRAHAFGPEPAFAALVAEQDGAPVGYATFHNSFDSDRAMRTVWLLDLFVMEQARGQGIGQRLMAAVARAAVERGAGSLWWGVRSDNARARRFYARLGAVDDDARILELAGDALRALADTETGSA
ncbi:MAG: GNAT family N-acetyltransferase [Alphaproteobacteria bacterium]